MFIAYNETRNAATSLKDIGAGPRVVTAREQAVMLTNFLNAARAMLDMGSKPPAIIRVTYTKVTSAKPRISDVDYVQAPGVAHITHEGIVCRVERNKKGKPYFTMLDSCRDPNTTEGKQQGFTALRLEGIYTFAFVDSAVQAAALHLARVALSGMLAEQAR